MCHSEGPDSGAGHQPWKVRELQLVLCGSLVRDTGGVGASGEQLHRTQATSKAGEQKSNVHTCDSPREPPAVCHISHFPHRTCE